MRPGVPGVFKSERIAGVRGPIGMADGVVFHWMDGWMDESPDPGAFQLVGVKIECGGPRELGELVKKRPLVSFPEKGVADLDLVGVGLEGIPSGVCQRVGFGPESPLWRGEAETPGGLALGGECTAASIKLSSGKIHTVPFTNIKDRFDGVCHFHRRGGCEGEERGVDTGGDFLRCDKRIETGGVHFGETLAGGSLGAVRCSAVGDHPARPDFGGSPLFPTKGRVENETCEKASEGGGFDGAEAVRGVDNVEARFHWMWWGWGWGCVPGDWTPAMVIRRDEGRQPNRSPGWACCQDRSRLGGWRPPRDTLRPTGRH
jgi:hypothetical protein